MQEIIIATRNKGKATEFKQMLQPYGINVLTLLDIAEDLPDVEETGTTFRENAQLKAETIANIVQKPVLADDSGLAVDYLDGRPGVYSARYAGEPTDDVKNVEKLLTEMERASEGERAARFICVLAFAVPGKETVFTEGVSEGTISFEPAGKNGFGYDPIFIPDGCNETMAQLDQEEKNKISHRYHALVAFQVWLDEQIEQGGK